MIKLKKLERSPEPNCFRRLRKSSPNIWCITPEDKADIWSKLNEMQNDFCAYCESKFVDLACHIEHLIPQHILKDIRNRSIYEWDNIYGSCDNVEHCGRYKDHKITDYDFNNLIRADTENASDYLDFLPDGHVIPKDNLANASLIKAIETIRVLNLDCPRLVNLRYQKIGASQMLFLELEELRGCIDFQNQGEIDLFNQEFIQFEQNITDNEYSVSVRQNTIG